MGKVTGFIEFERQPAPYRNAAKRQLDFIVEETQDLAIVEIHPRMEGRTMTLVIAPQKAPGKPKPPDKSNGHDSDTSAD